MNTKTLLIPAILASLAGCADEHNFTPPVDCPRHQTPSNDDGGVTPHWNCGSKDQPQPEPRPEPVRPEPETPYDPKDPQRPGYWDGVPIGELPS